MRKKKNAKKENRGNGQIARILDFEILPKIRPQELFPELEPEDQHFVFRMICPKCRLKTAILEKGTRYLKCPKDVGCGFHKSILDMMAYPEKPKGKVYQSIIQRLCEHTGAQNPREQSKKNKKKAHKKPIIFESIDSYISRGGKIQKDNSPTEIK